MDLFFAVFFGAIIVEGIVTYVRTFFVDGKPQWQMIAGIGIGVLVAVAYRIDLFALVGLEPLVPWVGCVLTGVLISRGSNYVFDLVGRLTKEKVKPPDVAA